MSFARIWSCPTPVLRGYQRSFAKWCHKDLSGPVACFQKVFPPQLNLNTALANSVRPCGGNWAVDQLVYRTGEPMITRYASIYMISLPVAKTECVC